MRFQAAPLAAAAGAALIEAVAAKDCPKAKNFIYVVPDGYGIASQVMARDYFSIINGEGTVARPNSAAIGVDSMVGASKDDKNQHHRATMEANKAIV
jgi:alkaline phosphatase